MKADLKNLNLNESAILQIEQCLELFKDVFSQDLLAVYLYGSAVVGGMQKYSDIDLFVALDRESTLEEKRQIINALLQISGLYLKDTKPPLEITIIEKAAINPWKYPPRFDFQYGEWLRDEFEGGNIEPWPNKEMPDLACLITQVLLSNKMLYGTPADQWLCKVPYKDFMKSISEHLPELLSSIASDTRNVLLTLARTWSTLETDLIRSKPAAAEWVVKRLPAKYTAVINRAKAICIGREEENWDDLQDLIRPCADFIANESHKKFAEIMTEDDACKQIGLA